MRHLLILALTLFCAVTRAANCFPRESIPKSNPIAIKKTAKKQARKKTARAKRATRSTKSPVSEVEVDVTEEESSGFDESTHQTSPSRASLSSSHSSTGRRSAKKSSPKKSSREVLTCSSFSSSSSSPFQDDSRSFEDLCKSASLYEGQQLELDQSSHTVSKPKQRVIYRRSLKRVEKPKAFKSATPPLISELLFELDLDTPSELTRHTDSYSSPEIQKAALRKLSSEEASTSAHPLSVPSKLKGNKEVPRLRSSPAVRDLRALLRIEIQQESAQQAKLHD